MCFPLAERQARHRRVDASVNLFLVPSIREYRKRNSQASRHPLRNARESPIRRDRLGSHLSDLDLERCRGSLSGFKECPQLGYRCRFNPVAEGEYHESPARHSLDPKSHRSGPFHQHRSDGLLHSFHPSTDHDHTKTEHLRSRKVLSKGFQEGLRGHLRNGTSGSCPSPSGEVGISGDTIIRRRAGGSRVASRQEGSTLLVFMKVN